MLATLNSDRFADLAPPQVFAQLLDEGVYLCSLGTMYRLLRISDQVRERRRLARHPDCLKPELVATAPRQVLTWDISKVRGPEKGAWFSLLVMIDIFSRYVVGWMLVRRANAEVAKTFIGAVLRREGIASGEAVVHADRGTEMTAQPVCMLLDALGVTRSHSRPRVSDDNPYSESMFKTLKHHPILPERPRSPRRLKIDPLEPSANHVRMLHGRYCSRQRSATTPRWNAAVEKHLTKRLA